MAFEISVSPHNASPRLKRFFQAQVVSSTKGKEAPPGGIVQRVFKQVPDL
jgi:hypothetical protein